MEISQRDYEGPILTLLRQLQAAHRAEAGGWGKESGSFQLQPILMKVPTHSKSTRTSQWNYHRRARPTSNDAALSRKVTRSDKHCVQHYLALSRCVQTWSHTPRASRMATWHRSTCHTMPGILDFEERLL